MFSEGYVFLLAAVIPFYSWQQMEEGRNLVSMLITGAFLIMWLATNTLPFVWDTTTIYALCFASWMVASIFWSNSRQSSRDLFFMLCGLVVFMSARTIPFEILVPILFVPGLIFSCMHLYNYKPDSFYIKRKKIEGHAGNISPKKVYPIFGNHNHLGAFMLIPLFAGAWLALNISLYIAILILPIVFTLALGKCRGAQMAAIIGLSYVACMQTPYLLAGIPVVLIVAYLICRARGKTFYESTSGRISLYLATLLLIKKAPLSGHGLRTFRREYSAVVPEIRRNRLLKHFYAKDQSIEEAKSHRVHNDHMEIILELGIIGYVLFILIFTSFLWTENILLSGAIIAYAVHGLFFFPLREAHTAYPFWALAGGIAGTSVAPITVTPIIATVSILIIARIMCWVGVKILGLSYYHKEIKIGVAPNAKNDALLRKQAWINLAIKCDPYNSLYLTEGYYYNVFDNPEVAFQFASRCMENFDGGKVRWGVCDQYARALLRLGGLGAAKMAVKYALHINPDFKQSQELMMQLEEMERTAQENQRAQEKHTKKKQRIQGKKK